MRERDEKWSIRKDSVMPPTANQQIFNTNRGERKEGTTQQYKNNQQKVKDLQISLNNPDCKGLKSQIKSTELQ